MEVQDNKDLLLLDLDQINKDLHQVDLDQINKDLHQVDLDQANKALLMDNQEIAQFKEEFLVDLIITEFVLQMLMVFTILHLIIMQLRVQEYF